jgi:hypothetical protein
MAYMRARHVIPKSMEWANTTSKTATSMKVKCTKE